MTSPAAFKAIYSDWRLIKGRKVVQVIFELPLEAAGQAYDVLDGMPDPSKSVWCAVARLDTESPRVAETEAKAPAPSSDAPVARALPKEVVQTDEKGTVEKSQSVDKSPASLVAPSARARSLAQRAGRLCNDPKFRAFLCEHFDFTSCTAEGAANVVRDYCAVQSRSEIRPGTAAEQRWNLLVSAYQVWDLAPNVGAA